MERRVDETYVLFVKVLSRVEQQYGRPLPDGAGPHALYARGGALDLPFVVIPRPGTYILVLYWFLVLIF